LLAKSDCSWKCEEQYSFFRLLFEILEEVTMSNIVSLPLKASDKKPVCNKQLLELIDYLCNLKENNFTGQLRIDFKKGLVNKIAFNQKANNCYNLSVNE